MQNATFFAKCNALCYTVYFCTVVLAHVALIFLILRLSSQHPQFGGFFGGGVLVPEYSSLCASENRWVVQKQ